MNFKLPTLTTSQVSLVLNKQMVQPEQKFFSMKYVTQDSCLSMNPMTSKAQITNDGSNPIFSHSEDFRIVDQVFMSVSKMQYSVKDIVQQIDSIENALTTIKSNLRNMHKHCAMLKFFYTRV